MLQSLLQQERLQLYADQRQPLRTVGSKTAMNASAQCHNLRLLRRVCQGGTCQAAMQGSSCRDGLHIHLLGWALFWKLHGVHDVHQHVAVLQVIVAEAQPPRVLGCQGVLQLLDLHPGEDAQPTQGPHCCRSWLQSSTACCTATSELPKWAVTWHEHRQHLRSKWPGTQCTRARVCSASSGSARTRHQAQHARPQHKGSAREPQELTVTTRHQV